LPVILKTMWRNQHAVSHFVTQQTSKLQVSSAHQWSIYLISKNSNVMKYKIHVFYLNLF